MRTAVETPVSPTSGVATSKLTTENEQRHGDERVAEAHRRADKGGEGDNEEHGKVSGKHGRYRSRQPKETLCLCLISPPP